MTGQQISTTNPYINQIRQSLRQTPGVAVDWLVLAHNDAHLLRRLDEAFPDTALAVIALPQSRWQVNDRRMAEVIEWALHELGVKGVMLVGHSQGGVPEESVKLLGGKARALSGGGEAQASPGSLIDRVKRAQAQSASVQIHFEEQMEQLSRMPAVEQRLARNQMQLHGLFYRGESGIFCAYDRQRRGFRPLLNEGAAA